MKTWTKKFQKMLTLILAICLVTGCMGFSNVQAATGKSGTTYYDTCINGKKGGTITTNGTIYYMSGTRKLLKVRFHVYHEKHEWIRSVH